jgi:hypothetical protein
MDTNSESSSNRKEDVATQDGAKETVPRASGDFDDSREFVDSFTPEEGSRIMRKIDYRLVPLLAVLYVVSYLDRSNSRRSPSSSALPCCFETCADLAPVANAKIAGMETDLPLSGPQYNMALTLFFIPYGLFEVPSNIVLKLLRPSIWISVMMLCWGTVMT